MLLPGCVPAEGGKTPVRPDKPVFRFRGGIVRSGPPLRHHRRPVAGDAAGTAGPRRPVRAPVMAVRRRADICRGKARAPAAQDQRQPGPVAPGEQPGPDLTDREQKILLSARVQAAGRSARGLAHLPDRQGICHRSVARALGVNVGRMAAVMILIRQDDAEVNETWRQGADDVVPAGLTQRHAQQSRPGPSRRTACRAGSDRIT